MFGKYFILPYENFESKKYLDVASSKHRQLVVNFEIFVWELKTKTLTDDEIVNEILSYYSGKPSVCNPCFSMFLGLVVSKYVNEKYGEDRIQLLNNTLLLNNQIPYFSGYHLKKDIYDKILENEPMLDEKNYWVKMALIYAQLLYDAEYIAPEEYINDFKESADFS